MVFLTDNDKDVYDSGDYDDNGDDDDDDNIKMDIESDDEVMMLMTMMIIKQVKETRIKHQALSDRASITTGKSHQTALATRQMP